MIVQMTQTDQTSSSIIRVFDEPFWVAPNSYIINGLPCFLEMRNPHRRIVEQIMGFDHFGDRNAIRTPK